VRSGRVRWRGDAGAPVRSPLEGRKLLTAGLAAAGGTLFAPAYGRLVAFR
jgi:hypothetical protein